MINIMPMSLSGYALTVKTEELKYGQLAIGPIKLTGED
nr:MAG TPA: hypothetical protein [Bacteriophage sp.]